jgi:hypothetical protein
MGQPINDFLDTLPGALFIVDAECRVIASNTKGLQHVNKDIDAIKGKLAGEVFECKHSKEPGGCGQTIHCKACTIRRVVTRTAETGESALRVPACLDLAHISKDFTVRFYISSEKVNDAVQLCIEDA